MGTIIIDEIHAVADDKRGSHLALSLARLEDLVVKSGAPRPQRVGLSATVNPIEEVAGFLSDKVTIVDVGHRREMDLAVLVPEDELGVVATNEMWTEIYDRLARLIEAHRTTLIFVNTRRLSERVSHHLTERLGEEAVMAHHGSLLRSLRLKAEEKLREGKLRAVVATASLELGIDIGSIELVCQIGSPRAIGVALQRVGRSGHWMGAKPKGRFFATTRDELLECAALIRAIRSGELDRLEIPDAPLDVAAQQIVAAAACEDWSEEDLFQLLRGTYSYRNLGRADYDAVLEMLSEGISTKRGRGRAYLHRDRVNHRLRGRRGARLAAITSGGAIPDNANYLSRGRARGKGSSARSMKTSRSRVSPATSSCSVPVPGASDAWKRDGCVSKTRTGPLRRFLFGEAKLLDARWSFLRKSRGSGKRRRAVPIGIRPRRSLF